MTSKQAEQLLKEKAFQYGVFPNLCVTLEDAITILSKVKESPAKRKFTPPIEQEFVKYFSDNGYDVEVAKRAYKGYDVAEWVKANGKPILNWKQTCVQVWFKPENLKKQQSSSVGTFTFFNPQ